MNFPSIPTDNLYKFQAIASLVFIIAWIYTLVNVFDIAMRSIDSIDRLQIQIETNEQEVKILEMLRDSMRSHSETAAAINKFTNSSSTSKQSLDAAEEMYLESIKNLQTGLISAEADLKRMRLTINHHRKVKDILNFVEYVGGVLSFIASLLMISGFRKWRVNVQEPIDKLLRMQLEAAEAEEDKALLPPEKVKEGSGVEHER